MTPVKAIRVGVGLNKKQSTRNYLEDKKFDLKVMLLSARTGDGMESAWSKMEEFRNVLLENGEMDRRRADQQKKWMWNYIQDQLLRVRM